MGFSLKSLIRPALGIAGTALGGPLGGMAGGAIGGLLAGKKKKVATPGINPAAQTGLDAQMAGATDKLAGMAYGNTGFTGLSNFDPSAAYKEYMGGAQDALKESFSTGLGDLAQSANASGRRNTGYFDQDVGDFGRNLARDFYRTTSGAALQTAGMTQDKYGMMAGIEEGRTDRNLDWLSGQKDRQIAADNARRQSKASTKNAIIGGIGTLGGAAIGAWLGRK